MKRSLILIPATISLFHIIHDMIVGHRKRVWEKRCANCFTLKLFNFKEVVLIRVLFHVPTILDPDLQNKILLFQAPAGSEGCD